MIKIRALLEQTNKLAIHLTEDPGLHQILFISYQILMEPYNCLLFNEIISEILFVSWLYGWTFIFYAFYEKDLWVT